jgi:hypothetical protein
MSIELVSIIRRGGIISLFFLFLSNRVVVAQGGFQKYYDIPGSLNANSNHAIERPDGGFIIIGEADYLIDSNLVSKLVLLGADAQGNYQWQKSYGSSALDFPSNLFQGKYIFCLEVDHFYYCGPARDSLNNLFTKIVKFDYSGDLISVRTYSDSAGAMIPMGLTKAVDGGFYLVGTSIPNSGDQPVFISKLNTAGNELWRKIINKGPPNVTEVKGVIQDSATKRLFAPGYQYLGSSTNNCLLITDSLGNKIKQYTYNNVCGGPSGSLIQLHDKNFLMDNSQSVDCFNGFYRTGLVKINKDGGFLWSYEHPSYGPSNFFSVVEERANGNLVVIGYVDSTYDVHAQYIVITSQGKLKFKKSFGRIKKDLNCDYLRGGMVTKDGGYVVAIQLTHEPDPTRFSFVKVDSLGCDTTPEFCECERTVGLKESQQLLPATVFPNPCNELLNVVTKYNLDDATLTLFDASGRIVGAHMGNGTKQKIATADLSPGIYFLEIKREAGAFRSNFVVQH